jgi:DNA repair protein REV1
MQAISVDEALLEVGLSTDLSQVESFATKIRNEIKDATGCDTSVGIGPNILLARMSTRKAKPAGQYHCKTQDDIDSLLGSQSVTQLPGVMYSISKN